MVCCCRDRTWEDDDVRIYTYHVLTEFSVINCRKRNLLTKYHHNVDYDIINTKGQFIFLIIIMNKNVERIYMKNGETEFLYDETN